MSAQGTTSDGIMSRGTRFSDLFATALFNQLTGSITITSSGGTAIAYFRDGHPACATAFRAGGDRLGEILVSQGACKQDAIDAALTAQDKAPDPRPLLGDILIRSARVKKEHVVAAMAQQTTRRLSQIFAVEQGTWRITHGSDDYAERAGIPIEGWPLLYPCLKNHASDMELQDVADSLLGKAVQLTGTPDTQALAFGEEEISVMKLIEKPRKPDQIERAIHNRRVVRGTIKVLDILGHIEIVAARLAAPISSTIKVRPPTGIPGIPGVPPPPRMHSSIPAPRPPSAVHAVENAPTPQPIADTPVVKELQELHRRMNSLDFFELLGIRRDTDPREIRTHYTTIARKFHPDAMGTNLPQSVLDIARAVSARLNEAYSTLSDPESRENYLKTREAKDSSGVTTQAQIEAARVKFEMGQVMLRKGDLHRARDFFHYAMANDPDKGLYKALYAWSIFADRTYDKREAMETSVALIVSAVQSSPKDATVQFYAGKIYRAKGDLQHAIKALEKALDIDPNHKAAQTELRVAQQTVNPSRPDNPALPADSKARGPTPAKKKKTKPGQKGAKPSVGERLKGLFKK